MVKTLEFKGYFDFADPETVFKLLYEDDSFTKFYHKEVNMDANASATAWIEKDGGCEREVTFKFPISHVPFVLRGLLGSDIAPLRELQRYTKVGSTITIHSDLSVVLFRGSTLISSGDTILSPLDKGCEIVVKVIIELQTSLPYWQDKVENEAGKEAERAFERWLDKARVFCERRIGIRVEPMLEKEDSFYDAEELDKEEASSPVQLNTDLIYGPPSNSSSRCSGTLKFLQVAWKRFCSTICNQIERETCLFRQSTFSVKPWTTFGLGIVVGLTLGLLYRRHLKNNQ